MKILLGLGLTVVTGAFVASCGYSPLYAPATTGAALTPVQVGSVAMAHTEIQPGQRLVAQEVRQKLLQAYPATEGTQLVVTIVEDTTTLALERTATIRRAQITLTGTLHLTDDTGKTLLQLPLTSTAAYNVENNPFSTESGKNFARQVAARNLAESVIRRVALWQRTRLRD